MHSEPAADIRALLVDGASPAAHARIVDERAAVDELLRDPATPPIYGFTTLLGHLDSEAAVVDDQAALLRAHLVGPVSSFPAGWGRMLLRVKLAQLAHGGSGLHSDTHERLVAASAAGAALIGDDPWAGNWTTSYSSGDVVPGAWFVDALVQRRVIAIAHPGDLIALINGHFVSTAAGLVVADRFSSLAEEALEHVRGTRRALGSSDVQLPVTIRDAGPIEDAADATTTALLTALRSRLAAPSANPRFAPSGDGLVAVSGSGFLDFRLTGALTQAVQACGQIGAYLKAVVRERTAVDTQDANARVQPTKIAEALLREISETALPTDFALAESLGVEDVADFSLATVRALARALQRVDALLDLAASVAGAERVPVPGALADAVLLSDEDRRAVLAGLAA